MTENDTVWDFLMWLGRVLVDSIGIIRFAPMTNFDEILSQQMQKHIIGTETHK